MNLDFTPVIIIGAGRSGTNMLRDTLCKAPGFATWDCDEINPIWRHGNTDNPTDHFTNTHATADVRSYLRKAFIKQWKKTGHPDFLVEKTCANSLRVSFIATVFPEAKFIYLVRNGTDVAVSACKRWRGEMEMPSIPYYWSKIKYTPIADLPIYAWRYIESRTNIFFGRKEHMSYWGPQFPGLKNLPNDTPLLEICAHQWTECVNKSDESFARLNTENWLKVKYEDLVYNPTSEFSRTHRFLHSNLSIEAIERTLSAVSTESVGKSKKSPEQLSSKVMHIMEKPLRNHGYNWLEQ